MVTHFNYDIITLEAKQPSDYGYIARVGHILRNRSNYSETVFWHEHQIPETWGFTKEEAYNKLENAIKEWIEIQGE